MATPSLRQILLSIYWRLLKPRTFGVKGVILHPDNRQLLLVQHSYGQSGKWNLPGGGYNPKRESSEVAIRRELGEELSLECKSVQVLGEYFTDAQGKQDTVTIFLCEPSSLQFKLNSELCSTQWVNIAEITSGKDYYRVFRRAAELVLALPRFQQDDSLKRPSNGDIS
jgi:8-oxo-dGTP diphosphatase